MRKIFNLILVASLFSSTFFLSCKKGTPSSPNSGNSNKTNLKGITNARTGKVFATLALAVDSASANDVINVPAGIYTNDFVTFTIPLTIQGAGGMAHFVATVTPPNGKAIFTVDSDVTFDHIEMSGSAVPDNNGAGIKQETGMLTLTFCYFHDNQDGVLTNPSTTGITITNCEFAHNGAGDGYSHNLYIGATPKATIRYSYFHDAVIGHEIKCRALNSTIEMCRIQNGSGTASYCIDLPQGGAAIIQKDTIEKGANAQNPNIIHFGGEAVNPSSSLQMSSNLVLSYINNSTLVLNQMSDKSAASLSNNTVFSILSSNMLNGVGTVGGTVYLGAAPTVNRSSLFHP